MPKQLELGWGCCKPMAIAVLGLKVNVQSMTIADFCTLLHSLWPMVNFDSCFATDSKVELERSTMMPDSVDCISCKRMFTIA